MKKEELKRLPFVVQAYRKIYPHHSTCRICGLPWGACQSKSVDLDETTGTFATCQYCWDRATLKDLLEAHTATYIDQYFSLSEKDRQNFAEKRPLEYVLECVNKEYDRTRNK